MLVSSTIADGPPRRLLQAALGSWFELVLPAHAVAELERVLSAKFGYSEDAVAHVVALLDQIAGSRAPTPRAPPRRSGDPDDDRIIAAALAAGASVLASGDHRHVLPLKSVEGMRILRPQDLLAELH